MRNIQTVIILPLPFVAIGQELTIARLAVYEVAALDRMWKSVAAGSRPALSEIAIDSFGLCFVGQSSSGLCKTNVQRITLASACVPATADHPT